MKIYIRNIGCQRRGLDSSKFLEYFRANGCSIVKRPEEADVTLLTTCGFTVHRVDDGMRAIKELERHGKEIIVLGCLPGCSPARLKREFGGKCLTPKDYEKIDGFFPDFNVKFSQVPDTNVSIEDMDISPLAAAFSSIARKLKNDRRKLLEIIFKSGSSSLGTITISRGCLGSCSYCVIRNSVGRMKSKKPDEVLAEFRRLLGKGYREFLIQGDDCGSYGVDIGTTLPELLHRLISSDGGNEACFYITTLNPQWLISYKDDILGMIRNGSIRGMELDIQTGSQRILGLMNRMYEIEELEPVLLQLKKINPQFPIYGQFMVGFPSETEEDFRRTYGFIERTGICIVHVFKYKDMDGTPSSKMKRKIPEEVKDERIARLADTFNAFTG